jgi:hypothetical protein
MKMPAVRAPPPCLLSFFFVLELLGMLGALFGILFAGLLTLGCTWEIGFAPPALLLILEETLPELGDCVHDKPPCFCPF